MIITRLKYIYTIQNFLLKLPNGLLTFLFGRYFKIVDNMFRDTTPRCFYNFELNFISFHLVSSKNILEGIVCHIPLGCSLIGWKQKTFSDRRQPQGLTKHHRRPQIRQWPSKLSVRREEFCSKSN